jgi:hypothetical protein
VDPGITFSETWRDAPAAMATTYGLSGLVLVGGIWPTLLHRFGPRHANEPQYDLDRLAGESASTPTTAGLTDADRQHLAELERKCSPLRPMLPCPPPPRPALHPLPRNP